MGPLNVVVTGSSGLLGRAVFEKLVPIKDKFNVTGLALSRIHDGKYVKVNLMDPVELQEAFLKLKPNVVIHCAALRQPDRISDDYEYAWALNVQSTKILADLSKDHSCHIIYLSTDYVFDGQNPPYQVSSTPHPLNKYGELKLEGEKVVEQSGASYTILRVPLLYGNVEFLGEGAVDAVLKVVLCADKITDMCDYSIRYPTYVGDVADTLELLLELFIKDEGIVKKKCFHWSGDEAMTKFDMAKVMGEVFGLRIDHVRPCSLVDENTSVSRPHNAHLDTSILKSLGAKNKITFKQGIKLCLSSHIPS